MSDLLKLIKHPEYVRKLREQNLEETKRALGIDIGKGPSYTVKARWRYHLVSDGGGIRLVMEDMVFE